MKFLSALVILLLAFCAISSAAFTYLGVYNGSNPDDATDSEKFIQPTGLLYLEGNLYVADSGNNWLYKMYGNYSFNTSYRIKAIKSQASEGSLSNPMRMVDENGTIYIADGTSGKIKYFTGEGSAPGLWNSGTNINKATGLAIGNESFYITDGSRGKLYAYSRATRAYSSVAVDSGGSDGQLASPSDIRFYQGKYYISDAAKNLIFVYDSLFNPEQTIGRGKGGIELRSPKGIKIYENKLYVADRGNNRVVVFTLDGYPIETLESSPEANFSSPEDIAVGGGKLYVADSGNALVHIFSINYSSSNDSVLQQIVSANQSIQSLQALSKVALSLGLPGANASFEQDLASAKQYYDDSLFSTAVSLSQRVIESASAQQADLGVKMDLKIRQMMKDAQDRLAPYRPKATDPEFSALINGFDNKVTQLQSQLSSKDYVSAAPLALSLAESADSFIKSFDEKKAQETVKTASQESARLRSIKSSLDTRIAAVKSKSQSYLQSADFSNADRLLAESASEIDAGSFDAANHSLSLAEFEVSSFESSLLSSAKDIDAALANISVIEFQINATVGKPMLLPPNIDAQRGMLSQARQTVYSNPSLGLAMASQALETAREKSKESQAYSVAASVMLMMLGLIGAIAIAFFLHLRNRGRKHEQKPEAKHGK